MTVLFSRSFSCFQAFSAAPVPPAPLSRPPFVTNLLLQPVSDLFQFHPAFPLPSRLISFSVIFPLPCCLIPFFAAFSPLSRLILDFFCYFQCIYNTFSVYFPRDHSVRISCIHQKYLFHSQILLLVHIQTGKRHRLSADGEPMPCFLSFNRWRASDRRPAGGIRARGI